ncbi:hypothetical protein Ssi03_24270 [Sphaerisporangium siamense]|uniref:Hydrogenase maturation factor n=1 Tax=Sphaerisporangium siamense TaxID=795645 RepID=A0A7W7D7W3_9ACTN|nr:HypC/HybG/HupF family hydrogenase formation chaperone [Sphaerisporangium siamense]MBB4701659.1 hydrogenase maturation factor [Sphaerisporangium siamense]GII84437.1 hypothetical protein Ssi03_24270 [Sphaerisporangium siamense]
MNERVNRLADACLTCSDEALPARVVRPSGPGLAVVEIEGAEEEVSVALVDAGPGDTVLVHAKEAIAVITRGHGHGGQGGHG